MACFYEVNVQVDDASAEDFVKFLVDIHVPQMLEIQGFQDAAITCPEKDDNTTIGRTPITCIYTVASRELIQRYFDNEAAAMRADTLGRFEGKMAATRRILSIRAQMTTAN